jgi:hypothetical protein
MAHSYVTSPELTVWGDYHLAHRASSYYKLEDILPDFVHLGLSFSNGDGVAGIQGVRLLVMKFGFQDVRGLVPCVSPGWTIRFSHEGAHEV